VQTQAQIAAARQHEAKLDRRAHHQELELTHGVV
jgi:hypothetical protein